LPGGNGRDSGIAGWENMGMGFKYQMGMGMGMGMKSLKWEGIGTKNLFPLTSTIDADCGGVNFPPPPHTHPFNGPFSGTTRVSRCQKGKTNRILLKHSQGSNEIIYFGRHTCPCLADDDYVLVTFIYSQ